MVYGTQITIVTGVYKPIYNWGAPHCMDVIFCQIRSDSDIVSHYESYVGILILPKNCWKKRWQNASGALCLGHLATFGFVKR